MANSNSTKPSVKTLVVDNFSGSMTVHLYGDINSGKSYEQTCSGQNPFLKPGQLTWSSNPVLIDSAKSVITDLIMAAKERVESGILYVYAIGHTGRLYKIQVNDPTTYNPNYDHPTLLATISINTPTFKNGGSMDFFGNTQKIFIGSDIGLTSINFDGSGEAFVGALGSWTQNVPRPLQQFVGNLYIGNGANIAQLDATASITSYTKLSPGFPTTTQVRDIDITPDGTYIEMVVSSLPMFDITSAAQQTVSTANSGSYIFKWNGSDVGYTAFNSFPSFDLMSNIMFQNYQYTFGTDQFGSAIYNPTEKILTIPESPAGLPNAIFSSGNLMGYMAPVFYNKVLQGYMALWGSNDFETGHPYGYWSPMFLQANPPETDIVQIPCAIPVSNEGFGSSSNNYTNSLFGTSKIYFSTLETSSGPTVNYRLYKWSINTSSLQSPIDTNAISFGYYQTQSQAFSKKVAIKEVRVYGEPWIANNSFIIDLIGSNSGQSGFQGNTIPIPGASMTFTAGSNLTIGNDFASYTPQSAPTYAIGLAITNLGTANHTINKVEIDYTEAGK